MEKLASKIHNYLQDARLLSASMIEHLEAINALVECWRLETHTFHFLVGECTVTLEDVALQLRVHVDGQFICGSTSFSRKRIKNLCQNLLGVRPHNGDIEKSSIRLTWLFDNFNEDVLSNLGVDVDDEVLWRHTRGYILQEMRLVSNKSTSLIHFKFLTLPKNLLEVGEYNEGSACLTILYRNLCHASSHYVSDIDGCL